MSELHGAEHYQRAFDELMALRGGTPPASGEVTLQGADPFHPTPFRVGEAASAVLAAIGVASNDLWEQRTGRRQKVSLDLAHAAATLRTVDYSQSREPGGEYSDIPIPAAMAHMLTVTQPWPTSDKRWFLPHLNLPHLAHRVLEVLGCESTPEAVRAAVASWRADELEEAIAAAHACGGTIRTSKEWLEHPQGRWLAARPVVEVERVDDGAPPVPPKAGERPLSGVKVLDLTRILAGPIGSRTLAEHGADVLMVTSPHLPQTPEHVRDTSHGKRSTFLDLRQDGDARTLSALAADADVFFDGYRPGALAEHGFGADELLRARPGLVHVSVSCFGDGGPFAGRAGWEQVAQAVTGVCETQGRIIGAGQPKLVFAPVCDYTTGYLAAYGAMLALARRAHEGGSWRVRVSLCGAAMFVQRLGLLTDYASARGRLSPQQLESAYVYEQGPYGDLRTLGPALHMSETAPRWALPSPRLGSSAPVWNGA